MERYTIKILLDGSCKADARLLEILSQFSRRDWGRILKSMLTLGVGKMESAMSSAVQETSFLSLPVLDVPVVSGVKVVKAKEVPSAEELEQQLKGLMM